MDRTLEQMRAELRRLAAGGCDDRMQAARRWLLQCGCDALGDDCATPSLLDVLARAAAAPRCPARRVFAVLVADALTIPDLIPGVFSRPTLDRAVCALLENGLPDVLLRARYPFGSDLDTKRRALARLAATLDDHLHPPEPTFPSWLTGVTPP